MPAAIDGAEGTDLFASFRQPAWHGLGTVFDTEVTDAATMLSLAHLNDWNLRFMDIEVAGHAGANFVVPASAVVRDNPVTGEIDVLGIVGQRYGLVSNEEAFAFLQSLHDGARWETAGAIKGGRVVFGSIAVEREFTLDPEGVADVTRSYLLVHTSHDGSTGVAGGRTNIRVVCQNTLDMAVKGLSQTFKIRHTKTADERMRIEAELWREHNAYFDAFEAEAQALYAAPVTDGQYTDLVLDLFPRPEEDKKGAFTKHDKRVELFTQAWKGAPNAGIRGTGWGALNALTEANQWGRKVRDGNDENFFAAGAGFDGPTKAFRQTALAKVKALTGV